MTTHDVTGVDRRRTLHEQAMSAGVTSPASLAVALAAVETEGWRVACIDVADAGEALVRLGKSVRPLARHELAQMIRDLRSQGMSFRQVGRRLEMEGIAAPHGGSTWHASSVRWVATSNA